MNMICSIGPAKMSGQKILVLQCFGADKTFFMIAPAPPPAAAPVTAMGFFRLLDLLQDGFPIKYKRFIEMICGSKIMLY